MKILHISSPGYRTAGKLAFDIHHRFLKENYKSFIVSKELNQEFESSYSYNCIVCNWFERKYNRLKRILNKFYTKETITENKYDFLDFQEDRSQRKFKDLLKKVPFKPDVIMIYALQGFINAQTIFKIQKSTGAKVYWLLYDMFAMTGGCHYSWTCSGFENDCRNCPAIVRADKKNVPFYNLNFKKKYLSEIQINVFPVSSWLIEKSKKSALFKNQSIIEWMLPQDIEIFKPEDKKMIKAELKLDPEKKYILFGAVNLHSERKGFKYLSEALKKIKLMNLDSEEYEIIIIGKNDQSIELETRFKINVFEMVHDKKLFARYYQAAHMVVIPSVQDAGPLMMAEAISCGTPVVCFDMGFAGDFIIKDETGYAAELYNSDDLVKGILKLMYLSEADYNTYSKKCRDMAENKLNFETQFNKLVDILSK